MLVQTDVNVTIFHIGILLVTATEMQPAVVRNPGPTVEPYSGFRV